MTRETPSNSVLEHPSAGFSLVTAIHQGARNDQEDALGHWFEADGGHLFAVVADGAGGHGGGSVASQAAIAAAEAAWNSGHSSAPRDPERFLADWLAQAHTAVNDAAAEIHRSARSVVVACFTDGRRAHWVHAGDSRLLRFHECKLVERTRDDSVVQVLFERGEISEEDMGSHPDQSRLLQSLGGPEPPTPRHGNADLTAGDVLILCSDGFWEHLKVKELETLVAAPAKRRQSALDQAVKTAVKRGGAKADNTTVIMIHCGEARSPSSGRFLLCLLIAAALGGLAAWWALWPGHPARSPSESASEQSAPASETAPPPEPSREIANPEWGENAADMPSELLSPEHTARGSSDVTPEQSAPSSESAPPDPDR